MSAEPNVASELDLLIADYRRYREKFLADSQRERSAIALSEYVLAHQPQTLLSDDEQAMLTQIRVDLKQDCFGDSICEALQLTANMLLDLIDRLEGIVR